MINSIVEISTDNKELSVYRGFLRIKEKKELVKDIPLDSFSCLIITGKGILITASLLSELAEVGIPLITLGGTYHPNGIFTPLIGKQRQQEIQHIQIKISVPLRKNLWAVVVREKIKNQSRILDLYKKENKLKYLSDKVLSGDSSNQEAVAAKLYFPTLFGKGFIRDPYQTGINSFLNYGYAILRATLARIIIASGLNPSFGINHHNKLNPFCLVDDLMEPYRAIIDGFVYKIFKGKEDQNKPLTTEYKKIFVEVINADVRNQVGCSSLSMIMQKDIWNFVNSLKEKRILLKYNQNMISDVF